MSPLPINGFQLTLIFLEGKCKIQDYINNLTPRENPVNAHVHDSLARLFEQTLLYIESVHSCEQSVHCYVHQMIQCILVQVVWIILKLSLTL